MLCQNNVTITSLLLCFGNNITQKSRKYYIKLLVMRQFDNNINGLDYQFRLGKLIV